MIANRKGSAISGLINIDKPSGLTSHDVVVRVRRLSGQRRVGHAGTLDPMATGVLLVCLGQATRLLEYLTAGRKQYRAVVRFGITTDTLDAEGRVLSQRDPAGLTETSLRALLPAFLGEIKQVPPAFSALKRDGRPLYELARAGQVVEVEPRRVTIYALTPVTWQPPDLTVDVACSPGTYIRSLARDLGEAAGPGAHLAGLTRTASGRWTLETAVPLAQLEEAGPAGWQRYLLPADQALDHFPRVTLTAEAARYVGQGRPVPLDLQLETGTELVRAYTPGGDFLAILTRTGADDTLWQPKKVFRGEESERCK